MRLLCGPQRSGRTEAVDRILRDHWGRALLLVPTRQYAARRAERLILEAGLLGAWGRGVMTFDDFVVTMLEADGKHPLRLRDAERRLLLARELERLDANGALPGLGEAPLTAGFVAHALRVITQLKQAAIEPEDFRERTDRRAHRAPMDDLVAVVYAGYQDALRAAEAYDLPGLFWEADLLCTTQRPAVLENIEVLLLDGFDDFTPSEFRLLVSLRDHVDLLVFGVSYDDHPSRRDLYAIPRSTAGRIQKQFGVTADSFAEDPPQTFVEFAASDIFWRDRPQLPPDLTPNLEILPCPDFIQEVETIGRRVKHLLLDEGVPADEIAVVFRNLREVSGTLRSVFAEFGIPVRIVQEARLTESAVCAFVLDLFDALESWRRETVADVLTSPWFRTRVEHADTFPLLSRIAQVVSGYDEWRARIEGLIARIDAGAGEDIERLLKRMPQAREAAEALLAGVEALAELGNDLARTPARRLLGALPDSLGISETIETLPDARARAFEREALRALREAVGRWVVWFGEDKAALSRREFGKRLRQLLGETTFSPPQDRHGVACLDIESVRHLRFDYVFFGGANEGETPRPPWSNAIYSDRDIEGLAQAGIPIEDRRAHTRREALLFHHLLNTVRKHLCVTWRTLSRHGQTAFPSPYIGDLIELFPQAHLHKPMPQSNAFVPEPAAAASWRDLRNAATWHPAAFATDSPLKKTFAQFDPLRVGAAIESARHDRRPFGIYDGVLADRKLVDETARMFDEDHLFSVQQIETYAACPFRFFVERILDVEEAAIPVAEFDARVRGRILHAVLEAFHERFRGQAVAEIPEAEALAAMRQAIARQFDRTGWLSVTAPKGVIVVEQRRIEELLERYLRIERKPEEVHWKPSHFEVAFGQTRGESRDPLTNAQPLRLDTRAGPVLFSGRIDRIDLAGEQARIVDYKTSIAVRPKDIKEGRSLQLAVYALALDEHLMKGAHCTEAYFLQVGRDRRLEALAREKGHWLEREQIARDKVAESVVGIRAGRFPPTPSGQNPCAYCPARRVCRYETARIERKNDGSPYARE